MRLDRLAVPRPLARLVALLPEKPPSLLVAAGLNAALAGGLLPRAAFELLAGRRLRIEASDTGSGVTLTFNGHRFAAASGAPDAVIRARVADFAALALRREDPDTLFFTRRLVIEGDTELGLAAKNALDALDWDRLPAIVGALLRAQQRSSER